MGTEAERQPGGSHPPVAANDGQDRLRGIYEEILPKVFGFCRSRLPLHDAEDVTADVFRSAAERLRSDPAADLSTGWFITAARNRIIDRWRTEARRARRLGLLTAGDPQRSDGNGGKEEGGAVLDALDRIDPLHRAVLLLHHVDGYSVTEIGESLGRSDRAVESLLARARKALARATREVPA